MLHPIDLENTKQQQPSQRHLQPAFLALHLAMRKVTAGLGAQRQLGDAAHPLVLGMVAQGVMPLPLCMRVRLQNLTWKSHPILSRYRCSMRSAEMAPVSPCRMLQTCTSSSRTLAASCPVICCTSMGLRNLSGASPAGRGQEVFLKLFQGGEMRVRVAHMAFVRHLSRNISSRPCLQG